MDCVYTCQNATFLEITYHETYYILQDVQTCLCRYLHATHQVFTRCDPSKRSVKPRHALGALRIELKFLL